MRAPKTSSRGHGRVLGIRGTAAGLIGLCGLYQVGVGLYFIALRPGLLPEDIRFLATGVASLQAGLPRLESWLHLVFIVLGGQIAAVGVLLIGGSLRIFGANVRSRWELVGLGAAGVLSVGAMAAVNFVLGSDFRWLLIAPGLAWSVGLILTVISSLASGAAIVADRPGRQGEGRHE